jgi:hypothetical protein
VHTLAIIVYYINLCVAGEDYESLDSIVTLAPMEQVLEYDIIILNDQRVERQEVFSVLLEIAPGQDEVSGLALGQSITDVFIKDDDCEPEIIISSIDIHIIMTNAVSVLSLYLLFPATYINILC